MIYAQIQNGTVINIIECDAAFAAENGLVRVDQVSPMPGMGWTTPDNGQTWTAAASADVRQVIRQRVESAIQVNATYLALGTPTAAQVQAQVVMLTKECTALIRLLLEMVDSPSGT